MTGCLGAVQGNHALRKAIAAALDCNVSMLAKTFPLAAFQINQTCQPPHLTITCPKSMKANISSEVQQALNALHTGQCILPLQPISQQSPGQVPQAVQQLQQKLQGQALLVDYRAATADVVITAFLNVLTSVEQSARACLGLSTQPWAQANPPATSLEHQTVALLQVSHA